MEEEKTMTIPSEKNFTLSKVKLAKGGGIEAQYDVVEVNGGESYCNHYAVSNAKEIHPDLAGLFKDMRPIVARCLGMTSFLTMLESEEMDMPEAKLTTARAFADELMNNIEVRGIALSGKDDNVGVIITSVLTVVNGLKTCINTPRIKMATISFGFEEELEEIVGRIEREVYEFLFHDKQAQLSLFGENPDDMPEDE